jgi:predicted AAA+ superfamily ATPase
MIRRKKQQIILKHLSKKEFTVLIGPRQIGKSTMLKQLFEDLTAKGETCYFLNLDRKDILDDLNLNPENLFKICPLLQDKKIIVFIDEIQYLDDATTFLKLLFDEYSSQLKIVATGSSAFYIDKQFNDSLVGRKKIFQMGTLDFEEFLHFKGRNDLVSELKLLQSKKKIKSIHENLFWAYLDEFINYGGYPAVVLENRIEDKIELLREIRDSYIKRDLLESGVVDETKFYRMLMLLASQSGGMLNVNEISNTLRITNATVENYLYVLQKCFHITLVKPFYNNLRKELTKMPKVYINDLGLRNILINYFSPIEQRADKGLVLENFCFRVLSEKFEQDQIKYWRTADGNEVDFIIEKHYLKGFAVEVKFNEQEAKLSKYKKFISNYPDFPLEFWWWKKLDLVL